MMKLVVALVFSAFFLGSVLGVEEHPKFDNRGLSTSNTYEQGAGSIGSSLWGDKGKDESCGGAGDGSHRKGYFVGYSHKGISGGGDVCKWGCCTEAFGYSHHGGGYYGCTCCSTAAEAQAYKKTQAEEAIKT